VTTVTSTDLNGVLHSTAKEERFPLTSAEQNPVDLFCRVTRGALHTEVSNSFPPVFMFVIFLTSSISLC